MQLKNKKAVKGIFEDLITEIEKYEDTLSPYCLVGFIFLEYFMDDVASCFIDKGLSEEKEESKLLGLLDTKAHLNLIMSNTKGAIKFYEEALKIDNNEADLWFKLSIAYSCSLQYTKAKDAMDKSLELMPENSERCKKAHKLIKQFSELSKEQIEIESLPEDEEKVRYALISAEEELLELDNLDYSGALVKYSKAIQIMMEENVSKPIANNIKNRNKNLNIKKYTEDHQSPLLFAKVLHEKKSPALGEWSRINLDLKKSNKNKLSREIKAELLNVLNPDIIDALEHLGKILQITRNKGSHEDIVRLDIATEIRNRAIPYINIIITYFY